MTRDERIQEVINAWKAAGQPVPLHRWLGWSREETDEFEELGVVPYPRPGIL